MQDDTSLRRRGRTFSFRLGVHFTRTGQGAQHPAVPLHRDVVAMFSLYVIQNTPPDGAWKRCEQSYELLTSVSADWKGTNVRLHPDVPFSPFNGRSWIVRIVYFRKDIAVWNITTRATICPWKVYKFHARRHSTLIMRPLCARANGFARENKRAPGCPDDGNSVTCNGYRGNGAFFY